jgi:hypothetical protein
MMCVSLVLVYLWIASTSSSSSSSAAGFTIMSDLVYGSLRKYAIYSFLDT